MTKYDIWGEGILNVVTHNVTINLTQANISLLFSSNIQKNCCENIFFYHIFVASQGRGVTRRRWGRSKMTKFA